MLTVGALTMPQSDKILHDADWQYVAVILWHRKNYESCKRAIQTVRETDIPAQPTEWQRIRDEIKAAMIFARADFVNVS
jgi:hypothetical protein